MLVFLTEMRKGGIRDAPKEKFSFRWAVPGVKRSAGIRCDGKGGDPRRALKWSYN